MARFSTVAARRFVLVVWPLTLWSLARHQPPWSDEAHFLVTVRQFGSDLSLELLRSYDELSAPLSYIAYAAWGHLVGFDASRLRLLSSVFASLTLICYTLVLMRESRDTRAVVIAVAIVAINPYFVGLSVFVFTDMLALLGMVVLWSGVQNGRAFATGGGLAVATLTRQYSAFLAAAIVISVAMARR